MFLFDTFSKLFAHAFEHCNDFRLALGDDKLSPGLRLRAVEQGLISVNVLIKKVILIFGKGSYFDILKKFVFSVSYLFLTMICQ